MYTQLRNNFPEQSKLHEKYDVCHGLAQYIDVLTKIEYCAYRLNDRLFPQFSLTIISEVLLYLSKCVII